MSKIYAVVIPLLLLWLCVSIAFSWGAIQDDALIHLRYADNLAHFHCIAYNEARGDYGASSLLYVTLLALLRRLTGSPNLARAVSSAVHEMLFAALAYGFACRLPKQATVARLAGLVLLMLLVTPSAVRWLDDGMETGVVVSLVSLLAWQIHHQFARDENGKKMTIGRSIPLGVLAFLAVMLRTELAMLCGFGFLLLASKGWNDWEPSLRLRRPLLRGLPLLIGAALALCLIVVTMHVLLPDTAVAKSHGLSHWFNAVHDTAITLGGAMSFGLGLLAFWLLTLLLAVLHRRRLNLSTAAANALFPVLLTVASLRGQEIQGVRYFAWTFFFSIVWNLLELARVLPESTRADKYGHLILCAFLVLMVSALPFEAVTIHRVLTRRSLTMRMFEAQHLYALRESRGIAADIGYIGYFTRANICDLAGLVNGRAAARMSSLERAQACVRTDADFLFVNISQLVPLMRMTDLSRWKVCGSYEFTNVSSLDTHYLLVRPEIEVAACAATAQTPEPIESILPVSPPDSR